MPGTALQLYPAAQPRVNVYRSILTEAGGVGADLVVGARSKGLCRPCRRRFLAAFDEHAAGGEVSLYARDARLAWEWRKRVNGTSAWLRRCLPSRSLGKLSYLSPLSEVTGDVVAAPPSSGFEGRAMLMRASCHDAIGAARLAGLGDTRHWRPMSARGGANRHRRGGKA